MRLIVWCLDCHHQVEPDPAEMAARYGAEMTVSDWHARLVCGQCGSRLVDFVVTETEAQSNKGGAAAGEVVPRLPATRQDMVYCECAAGSCFCTLGPAALFCEQRRPQMEPP